MTRAISTEDSLLGLTTPAVHAEDCSTRGRGESGVRTRRKQRSRRIERHRQRRAEWRAKLEKRFRRNTEVTAGLIPDLHSRYFTSDFPYGLAVIRQIGDIAGVSMPNIDALIEWYDNIALINDKIYLSDYGIANMDDLRSFYLQ